MRVRAETITVLSDKPGSAVHVIAGGFRFTFNADEARFLASGLETALGSLRVPAPQPPSSMPPVFAEASAADQELDTILRQLRA